MSSIPIVWEMCPPRPTYVMPRMRTDNEASEQLSELLFSRFRNRVPNFQNGSHNSEINECFSMQPLRRKPVWSDSSSDSEDIPPIIKKVQDHRPRRLLPATPPAKLQHVKPFDAAKPGTSYENMKPFDAARPGTSYYDSAPSLPDRLLPAFRACQGPLKSARAFANTPSRSARAVAFRVESSDSEDERASASQGLRRQRRIRRAVPTAASKKEVNLLQVWSQQNQDLNKQREEYWSRFSNVAVVRPQSPDEPTPSATEEEEQNCCGCMW